MAHEEDKRRRRWVGVLILAFVVGIIAFGLALGFGISNSQSINRIDGELERQNETIEEIISNVTLLEDKTTEVMDNVTDVQDKLVGVMDNVTDVQTKLDGVMNNVTDLQNTTTYLQETIDTVITNTTTLQILADSFVSVIPIHGWMLFWWENPGVSQKSAWGRFNETTGIQLSKVPYTPSEARGSGTIGKSQFSRGPNPNDMIYLVYAEVTNVQYLVRHNPAAGTYLRTYIGASPALHGPVYVIDYDPVYNRYVGVSWIPSKSYRYALVLVDENTGAVSEFTGAASPLNPDPTNVVLDMEIIGNYVLVFERWDDDPYTLPPLGQTNRILFYNSTDGQYLSQSFHNGTYIPYPGTFLSANLDELPTGYNARWFIAASYDPATFRLHVVIAVSSSGNQREVGWIQATSEEDMLNQLLTGNYAVNIVQHTNPYILNAGVFLTPAPIAKK